MDRRPPFDVDSVCAAVAQAIALKRSQQKLAAACGFTQAAISRARISGRLSPHLAIAIHRATAGAVSGSVLRPDLWRRPQDVPVEGAPTLLEPQRPADMCRTAVESSEMCDGSPPWSRRELVRMDRAFCDAMERAIARGSERPRGPAATPKSARAIRRFDPPPRRSGASSPAALCAEAGERDRFW